MLTIYEHPSSAYAMKVKMPLLEKGLEFQALVPAGMANETTAGEFVEASPRAEVPALVDGDIKLFDSTIILEYVEDKRPTPRASARIASTRPSIRIAAPSKPGTRLGVSYLLMCRCSRRSMRQAPTVPRRRTRSTPAPSRNRRAAAAARRDRF